jgi:proline iminopeptidase
MHGRRRRALLLAGAGLLGIAAGLAALFVAASITSNPSRFLLAGLVAFAAVWSLGAVAVTRGTRPVPRWHARTGLITSGVALAAVLFALAALRPLGDPRLPPAPVSGQSFWDLSTGSRIAYVHVPAAGPARPEPVIVLHGGPGVPDLQGDSDYFGALARDGFDVYVYAQVGSGRSTRLTDPRGYSLERDVADLEEIRKAIGAKRVILIGHSYGGMLAAAYAALHPGHAERMALISPQDPAPAAGGASMLFRLDFRQKLGVYALIVTPRPLLAYGLLQINPEAAHVFVGDAELDARQDRVYARTRPALHCRDKPPGPELHGLGFYANQFPQSAAHPPHVDFLPDLSRQRLPALIIKGRCDYLSWSSAVAYRKALADPPLIYIEEAGHNVYQDAPEQTMALLHAFLLDRSLPEAPYAVNEPPPDYEGSP